jgi:hypothetical protein
MSDITVIDYHKNRAIGYLNEAARNIILVGHELIAIKAELGPTEWGKWVEENLHIKQKQAHNWMKLAKESNTNMDLKRIQSLSTTVQVLFLEADPIVQQKVIEKVEKGEMVNKPQLLEMKRVQKELDAAKKESKMYEGKYLDKLGESFEKQKEINVLKARVRELSYDVSMQNIEILRKLAMGGEVGGDDVRQSKINMTRLTNQLEAAKRELDEINKQKEKPVGQLAAAMEKEKLLSLRAYHEQEIIKINIKLGEMK